MGLDEVLVTLADVEGLYDNHISEHPGRAKRYYGFLEEEGIVPFKMRHFAETEFGRQLLHVGCWAFFSGRIDKTKFEPIITLRDEAKLQRIAQEYMPVGDYRIKPVRGATNSFSYMPNDGRAPVMGRMLHSMGSPIDIDKKRERLPEFMRKAGQLSMYGRNEKDKAAIRCIRGSIVGVILSDRYKVRKGNKPMLDLNYHPTSEAARTYAADTIDLLHGHFPRQGFTPEQIAVSKSGPRPDAPKPYFCSIPLSDEQVGALARQGFLSVQANY